VWDLLLVSSAKLVVFLFKPLFDWLERRKAARQRERMHEEPPVPIASARPRQRVKIAGVVEPAARAPGSRVTAVFVRDEHGGCALVQPASATAIWCERGDGANEPHVQLAHGDRVIVAGVARAADAAIDRELDGSDVRLVFAGSEVDPLYIARVA